MSSAYDQLLGATIQHFENLKARGVRHVAVAPEILRSLSESPARGVESLPASVAPIEPAQTASVARSAAILKLTSEVPTLLSPFDAPSLATATSIDPTTKATAFAELRTRALVCIKCPHLASSRKNVVFGVGNIDSPLMFVGEAPGADEDEQGEPFVGQGRTVAHENH